MDEPTSTKATCEYCGKPVHPLFGGWAADDTRFGDGMVSCRPARDAGNGRLHQVDAPALSDADNG